MHCIRKTKYAGVYGENGKMQNIDFKLIYRITSVIAMIFFFIPTCTVSCGWVETNVSVAHAVIGYESDYGGWYSEPQVMLVALILIPVGIFILSMRQKEKREETANLIAVLSGGYMVSWLVLHFLIQLYMDQSDIALPYEMTPNYYLAILDGGIMFAVSIYELYLIKNPSEFGEEKKSQFVSSIIDNAYEKERLWMCDTCYKTFAISDRETTPNCPNCKNKLLRMDVSVANWEKMSIEERLKRMEYCKNGGIREILQEEYTHEDSYRGLESAEDVFGSDSGLSRTTDESYIENMNTLEVSCIEGDMIGEKRVIQEEGKISIGRSPECDFRFLEKSKGVSRKHCTIEYDSYVCTIVDNGSRYGTYINSGKRITVNEKIRLNNMDIIYLGGRDNQLQVRY